MKYAIVIPDGCADEGQPSIAGRTPLEEAQIPAMDEIVRRGVVGRASNVPSHLPAGSAVANMSLLGYDPKKHFTGRAPLEAAAQGIDLGPDDWAIRCNLVTVENQIMKDFTAGHISSEDASELLDAMDESRDHGPLEFFAGVSYRNLLVYRGSESQAPFSAETLTTPPHDLTDKSVADDYPRGPGSSYLCQLMNESLSVFGNHPVNLQRRAAGKSPATNIWLWGLGKAPQLPSFHSLHQVKGTMITAVDLLRGLASLIGWSRIEVPGATGYTDTDYAAKGKAAVAALPETDLICVHVEAPDEASHEGDLPAKIKALEEIDRHIVAPLTEALADYGDHRILISPDHPTPIRTKTHSHGFVPFAIAGSGVTADAAQNYDEPSAGESVLAFDEGWQMMKFFLGSVQ